MARQTAPIHRARELLLAEQPLKQVVADLRERYGVSSADAIAAIVVGRSLNRFAEPSRP